MRHDLFFLKKEMQDKVLEHAYVAALTNKIGDIY